MAMQQQWRNARNELVTINACGCMTIGTEQQCRCRAPGAGSRRRCPDTARRTVAPPPPPPLTEQVRRELAKAENAHVLAAVDEERGVVRTYLRPRPYFEQR